MKKSNAARIASMPKIKVKSTPKLPPDMDIFEILDVPGKVPKLVEDEPSLEAYIPGFEPDPMMNIYVPTGTATPVPPSRLERGLKEAKHEISRLLKEFSSFLNQNEEVKEMEFTVSFSADGKFMGFGVGGAVEVKVKVGAKK